MPNGSRNMRGESRELIRRVVIAVTVGLLVAGIAYLVAYFELREFPNYHLSAWQTHWELQRLNEDVESHRRSAGRLPTSLSELEGVKGRYRVDVAGQIVDSWDRPYQYRAEGDSFTLVSYGRDGQPGGEGDDADLEPCHPLRVPNLHQFTFELPTGGIRWTCLLSGICAGLICLRPSRDRRGIGFLVRVGATAIGAVLVAVVLSIFHIPTGH